jgi:uncharacterized protein YdeI (YjbR/CyaY-like superfamily)
VTVDELHTWLEANHETATEHLVELWRKGTGVESVTWNDVVDECLCFGWIDGRSNRVDDERWTIRITPRRRGSNWSRKNLKRFDELRAEGRIRPAGLAIWEARDPARTDQYSFEREQADLAADEWATFPPAARAFWDDQPPGYRRAALHWVTSAKRADTRARRLAELVDDSANGLRIKLLRR